MPAPIYFSRPSLHPGVIASPDHKKLVESTLLSLPVRQRRAERLIAPAVGAIQIPLTAVSLNTSFDAYIDVWFKGTPAEAPVQLLLDSGNSVLVVPHWEDIAALPNYSADYTVLGAGTEPWGCPANILQGPIDLATAAGDTFTLPECQFYACTADSPSGDGRTANFGAGCLSPWTASGWNTPAGTTVTLKAPLAYNASYPFAEFVYVAAATMFGAGATPKVITGSYLNLLNAAPSGYTMFDILPNVPWMSLTPKTLSIGTTKTAWPGTTLSSIAMIDTGGGPVFLSDPKGYLYSTSWPDSVPNPSWTSDSTNCQSISDSISIDMGDTNNSDTFTIDPTLLPESAQGLTLVICEMNEYMRGEYGMNIGGLSALVNYILVDYLNFKVGLKSK